MTGRAFRGRRPAPTALTTVSPTLVNDLLSCPMRAAFKQDPALEFLRRRPSPDAVLGIAAHAIAEAATKGSFDNVAELEAALAGYWKDAIGRELQRFDASELLGPVPDPVRWPNFQLKRARAIEHAQALVAARAEAMASGRMGARIEPEVSLSAVDPPLTGRIDRVEHTADGVRLVDLKSGTKKSEELLPAHRVQLLLYAALYRAARGEAPTQVATQHFDGSRTVVDIDWDEVEDLVRQVIEIRDRVNALTQGPGDGWLELAQPSPSVCRYCNFQPVCGEFFTEVAQDQPSYAACTVGTVEEATNRESGVRLTLRSELAPEGPLTFVIAVPPNKAPRMNQRVSVCWAARLRTGHDLRVSWQSALYEWQEGSASGHSLPRDGLQVSSCPESPQQ